jgi:large subunit ribosomal protein L21
MKYLIVNVSGKQFCFKPGEWQDFDFIKTASIGSYLWLKRVLFYRQLEKIQVGQPFLKNAKVVGKVLQNYKGKKFLVLKTKPKKHYTRAKGHRQVYTRVQIQAFTNL